MWRRLRGRFGIAAPRVAVYTHVPWYWRGAGAIFLMMVLLALGFWLYETGRGLAGTSGEAVAALNSRVAELEKALAEARTQTNTEESRQQIERTSQQQLIAQIKTLEQENGRLKEDLAIFENFAVGDTKAPGISINRLRVEPDNVPGQFHYRMLLTAQGGKKSQEFKGTLQLVAELQQDGKSAMMILPAANDPDRQRFNISFKHFRRIDGVFQIPAGAELKSLQARLMQDGAMTASQTVKL